MTTIDGYFSRRPIPSTVVILDDEDEDAPSSDPAQSSSSSQKRQRRRLSLSEGSEMLSETESLPPEYESRRPSGAFEGLVDRQALLTPQGAGSSAPQPPPFHSPYGQQPLPMQQQEQQQRQQPLLQQTRAGCECGHPQCMLCSVANTIGGYRGDGSRSCSKSPHRKRLRRFCSALFVLIIFWLLLSSWRLRRIYRDVLPVEDEIPYPEERLGICRHTKTKPHDVTRFNIPFDTSGDFTFEQFVEERPIDLTSVRRQVHVEGHISIKNAVDLNEVPKNELLVTLSVQVSDDILHDEIQIEHSPGGRVSFKSPRTLPDGSLPACVIVGVTVMLPNAAHQPEFREFRIHTETLAISLEKNIGFKTDTADLRTIASHITSALDGKSNVMNATRLSVNSISGAIRGSWGVGDEASLNTKSGSIQIGLFPLTSSKYRSSKVKLDVHTISGSISVTPVEGNVRYPFRSVKTFNTDVSSSSGSITGQYNLGSSLSITSISGRIDADIVPIAPGKSGEAGRSASHLRTDTKSGSTAIHFLYRRKSGVIANRGGNGVSRGQNPFRWVLQEPRRLFRYLRSKCPKNKSNTEGIDTAAINDEAAAAIILEGSEEEIIPAIVGSHKSVSGSMRLHYPGAFDGAIFAKSLTASVHVDGEGVEIIRKKHGWPVGTEVEAVKGNSSFGMIEMETVSGSINLMIS